ncbi:MAG: superoxide dismutase [Chloroflexi bacterium]|nr:superoxide dismutase [Chloroflexota bacterium]
MATQRFEPTPLPFRPEQLRGGITSESVRIHHDDLYGASLATLAQIEQRLCAMDYQNVHHTSSPYRELKLHQGFTSNARRLHELYFQQLGGTGQLHGRIIDKITEQFGSFESWRQDFMAAAMAARAVAVLAYDIYDGRLSHVIGDSYDHGAVWGTVPILVIDVAEHAYLRDFGPNKKGYIEAFLDNLNWEIVTVRYEEWERVP